MIHVFHSPKIRSSFDPDFPTKKDEVKDYSLVAAVDTDDLDEAYYLTNHIDHSWYENKGVTVYVESRSTSVGDVLVTNDGTMYIVAMIGFTVLE